ESIIARPEAKATRSRTSGAKASQVQRGVSPEIVAKMNTTTRFRARLKQAVRTTDIGITMRGNWIFRTRFSRPITHVTAPPVASERRRPPDRFAAVHDTACRGHQAELSIA